jgi:hypothetical protein
MTDLTIDCTGDVVVGDIIQFTEAVFGGSYRRPAFLGDRTIEAQVIADSYGAGRQQHTFTILVVASGGTDPLAPGAKTTRKARNVYRNGTRRAAWADETARRAATGEKHGRGDAARADRARRLGGDQLWS